MYGDYVYFRAGGPVWIGLRRLRIDDKIHFQWIDGSSYDYSPSGYSRSGGGNAYVATDANTWERRLLHNMLHSYHFACRRPYGEIPFSTFATFMDDKSYFATHNTQTHNNARNICSNVSINTVMYPTSNLFVPP